MRVSASLLEAEQAVLSVRRLRQILAQMPDSAELRTVVKSRTGNKRGRRVQRYRLAGAVQQYLSQLAQCVEKSYVEME